jgi:hypothetical protein
MSAIRAAVDEIPRTPWWRLQMYHEELDGVEVGRVGRKIAQLGSSDLDRLIA